MPRGGPGADVQCACGRVGKKGAARVAGRDIGKILFEDSANELAEILWVETESGRRCPVAHELAGLHRGQFQTARGILSSLKEGVDDTRG